MSKRDGTGNRAKGRSATGLLLVGIAPRLLGAVAVSGLLWAGFAWATGAVGPG